MGATGVPTVPLVVRDSPELRRVVALPRREWSPDEAGGCARWYSSRLTSSGTLRPVQGVALHELATFSAPQGLILSARVGAGKTLVSLLAGTVTRALRPLLLIPAHLREKTIRDAAVLRAQGWRITVPRIVSYQELAREDRADLLDTYQPDLIVADEAHYLRHRSSGCTKRVGRYLKRHQECRFIAMSGTLVRNRLADYAHLAAWALRDAVPLPRNWDDLEEWGYALDDRVDSRYELGPLVSLYGPREWALHRGGDPLGAARCALRRRCTETFGWVATTDSIDVGLEVRVEDTVQGELVGHLRRLEDAWELPDGTPLESPLDVWRASREVALGFWYQWDPSPPREWSTPRREWCRAVREVLGHSRSLDTPAQVATAVDDGRYPALVEPLARWRAVRDTYTPTTVTRWLSPWAVDRVMAWLREGPGLAWIEHGALARALEERGVRVYGSGGMASDGRYVDDERGACAVSVRANSSGRNLQTHSRNLVVSPPASGETWEQLLGRTHRDGQMSDVVTCDVWLPSPCHRRAWATALGEARYAEQTTGQVQKLTSATILP